MKQVTFDSKGVNIDGKTIQIISGAMHYFRIPRALWQDRLERAKACGLNAVETYMCWNLHEPQPGKFHFENNLDFETFIRMAGELGLYVIVRPGPYICSEWDNGGFPGWLTVLPGIRLRRMNQPYLEAVKRYYNEIMPRLAKLQYIRNGPVIAMQLENEYGSFAHDKEYLRYIRTLSVDNGIDVVLFTADGASDHFLQGGMLEGTPLTLTFGSNSLKNFAVGRKYQPQGPDFCMEFWHGWFDHWSEKHQSRAPQEVAREVDDMLNAGGSVNFYMFHGGTNWGFNNGANEFTGKDFAPIVTSYDFDAPVSECGDLTPKFFALQEVIRKYRPDAPFAAPPNPEKFAPAPVSLTESASLFDNLDALSRKHLCFEPEPMEKFGEQFGFIHYRKQLSGPVCDAEFNFPDLHDRAQIYLDGRYLGTIYRNDDKLSLSHIDIPAKGAQLDILVENMGHINYGLKVGCDLKGLTGGMSVYLQYQFNWEVRPIPMNDLSRLEFKTFALKKNYPAFHRGIFELTEIADTFVKFPGEKGVVWINGINLGRYWNVGPGATLYLPACYLRKGKNEIIVFELHNLVASSIEFLNYPLLG